MLTVALVSHARGLCGAERMLFNLARLLEKAGSIRPVLLVPGEGDLAREARRHGIACHLVPHSPWYFAVGEETAAYCRAAAAGSDTLKTLLVDLNCDLVLVNTMSHVAPLLAAVALDLPSVLWIHGVIDTLVVPYRSSEFAAPHDEMLLHAATRAIAVSKQTSEFWSHAAGRRPIDVIANWTDFDPEFAAAEGKYRSRRFVCLNTFDPHKGHATLLDAAALLKQRGIVFELHLYGDGLVREAMEFRAALKGLTGCVFFHGRTTEVEAVYDAALAVVNPAQFEPFGMTLIEGMARKTPAVATRSGGPEEILVDGESGFLVDRGDTAALADRMQALLESPDLARRLGEAGHKRVGTHFQEANATAAFVPLIETAVRDFRGYQPTVKTLVNMYNAWLQKGLREAVVIEPPPPPPPPALPEPQPALTPQEALPAPFLERARVLARDLDSVRQRRMVRVADRIFNRYDLHGRLSAAFAAFPRDLPGFHLQSSVNLARIGGQHYRLPLPQTGLRGIVLAPIADVPPGGGSLRVEIRSPGGDLVVQHSIAAAAIEPHAPLRVEFPPLDAQGPDCFLGVFSDGIDVPFYLLEWHKYRLWGLGPTISRPFCALVY